MVAAYDVIIENGRWFDGLGSPSGIRHLGIRGGRVATISETPIRDQGAAEIIDATDRWVMPGFVDIHTHYDAEVLVSPGLDESVRHGVTTIFMGSCSLSTVHAEPLDCADLFSRVEAVPRHAVLGALQSQKTWHTAEAYARHLESLPLGPNIAAFLGHSDLRTFVMGLGRAVDGDVVPTESELKKMTSLLEDALDAGFLGLSTMLNPWDKLDGDRYRSKPLPSTFARWGEYRRLHEVLRKRRRVLQSAPNLTAPAKALAFFAESMGAFVRTPLKTSLLVAADPKTMAWLVRTVGVVTRFLNRFADCDLKWQHIPVPFEVYADGIDLVVFEEFGAGRAALHLTDEIERNTLMKDEAYRRRFRKDYERRFTPRVWQRDFFDAQIVDCPDRSIVGRSFGQVARARGVHPVDCYLDLVVEHGKKLRWRTTIANHRPEVLDRMATHPEVQMGFADSGAHLRNMAFYNFPVRFLRRVDSAAKAGHPFMSIEHAVHRLTGELATWFGIDAGRLEVGDRADVAIVDPKGLDADVDGYYESYMEKFALSRMVNRSDRAVVATLIGGRIVYRDGAYVPGYGASLRTGRFLRVGEPRGTVASMDASRSKEAA
jgi:N-acyl-D-aspartate/D-glutamate deacylase